MHSDSSSNVGILTSKSNLVTAAHDMMAKAVAITATKSQTEQKTRSNHKKGVRIERTRINSFCGQENVHISVLLHADADQSVILTLNVEDNCGSVTLHQYELEVKSIKGGAIFERTIGVHGAHLWSPENPYLYNITISIDSTDGKRIDTMNKKFGIRSIAIGEDLRLYLNGNPIFLRGTTWVPGYSLLPFEPSFCEKLLGELRKQGFNYIRHHSIVPPYDWYYDLCDRLGMMMSVEMGFGQDRTIEVVTNHFNHPSVLFWAGCNESHCVGTKAEPRCWYETVKKLDDTRPIYDCSGWGEYDRDTTDILVQHFGYEFPYMRFENLYERYDYYQFDGSAKGVSEEEIQRAIREGTFKVDKPQIVHELQGNAQTYSDRTLVLDARMREIWEHHGYDYANWPVYVKTNQEFVRACYKINIEAARRADNQVGFEILTVADSVAEYNRERRGPEFGDMDITGTCDALGESKHHLVKDMPVLNAAHIVLIDTHSKSRTLWNDQCIEATVLSSCHDYAPPKNASMEWRLKTRRAIVATGAVNNLQLKYPGTMSIAELQIPLYEFNDPQMLVLEIDLVGQDYKVSNNWKFWVFPRLSRLGAPENSSVSTNIKWLYDCGFAANYYPHSWENENPDLFITDHLGEQELKFVDNGGRLLLLQDHCKEGFSCTPTAFRHRMYHSWVGGHSMGIVVHDHAAMGAFPHAGFNDIQFYQAIQSGDRLMLDDMPVPVQPIMESVPSLEYNQSRSSGYLAELSVGNGSILVSSLKLSNVSKDDSACAWLLHEFISYCLSNSFAPVSECSIAQLEEYMAASRERVWVTGGPLWYLYPADDLDITKDCWETRSFNIRPILPHGGIAKTWIDPVGDDGWGSDEWGLHSEFMAVDGYRAHYWEPNALPADYGVEWPHEISISKVVVEFVDDLSVPHENGWHFQIEQNGEWSNVDVVVEKASELIWNIYPECPSVSRFRFLFTKMNEANTKAVLAGAMAGGARAAHPLPTTWLKEKAVPRIRCLTVSLR